MIAQNSMAGFNASSMSSFFDNFTAFACSEYSCLQNKGTMIPEALISAHVVQIPKKALTIMSQALRAFFELRQLPEYSESLTPRLPLSAQWKPKNFGVMMSYDFHLTPEGPRLIEINTNAGFSLGAELVQRFHTDPSHRADRSCQKRLIETFLEEWQWARPGQGPRPQTLAIVDEEILKQNFYVEFLMFQELFEREGIQTILASPEDLHYNHETKFLECGSHKQIDFVYNRSTDFFLEKPSHAALRTAFEWDAVVLSPHPREYALLADKQRLIDWSSGDFLQSLRLSENSIQAISAVLEPTRDITSYASPDELWSLRKGLFFKPKKAYGGKAAYKGASLSQGKFLEIQNSGQYVVQPYIPAGSVLAPDGESYKYDIRCYAYRDELLLASARLYQGQVTNFRSPGGGFGALLTDDS